MLDPHLKHDKDVRSMRMPEARCHFTAHQTGQKAHLHYLSHEAILCFFKFGVLRALNDSDSRIKTQESLLVQDRVVNRKKKL